MSRERFFPMTVEEVERTCKEMQDSHRLLYNKMAAEYGWKSPPVLNTPVNTDKAIPSGGNTSVFSKKK